MTSSAGPLEIAIRTLTIDDVPHVAAVHCSAFLNNALSRLGKGAVTRHYSCLHEGPFELVALGAFGGNSLKGFCYGGMLRGEISYFLSRHRVYLAGCVLAQPWLIANPLFRHRLLAATRLLRRPQATGPRPAEVRDESQRSFGILSIAVDPGVQGSGIGASLLRAAEAAARSRGYARMHLTVHPDNMQAIRFYEGLGWTRHMVDGRCTTGMRKTISDVHPPRTTA